MCAPIVCLLNMFLYKYSFRPFFKEVSESQSVKVAEIHGHVQTSMVQKGSIAILITNNKNINSS